MESQKSTSAQLSTAQAALAAEQTRGEAALKRETDEAAARVAAASATRKAAEDRAQAAQAAAIQARGQVAALQEAQARSQSEFAALKAAKTVEDGQLRDLQKQVNELSAKAAHPALSQVFPA